MNKKVLIDLERLRYPNSGIANVFRNLAKGLRGHTDDLQIELFGPKDEFSKHQFGFKEVSRKTWHKFLVPFSHRYGIIHVSHQFSSYFNGNHKSGVKIVTLHDLNFLHEHIKNKKKYIDKVNDNIRYADYIVCISDFVKQDFIKNQSLFALEKLKEVVTIYNGLHFPDKKDDSISLKERFEDLDSQGYLLNIGVLFPKKNQLSLIKMLPYTTYHLVLIVSDSKAEYELELLNEVKRLKLEKRVHIFRNVSEQDKNILIQHCAALCHPSLAEGFGIPVIEAMYLGKPVFLSTLTSLPEIGGEYACYFKDFDPQNMAQTLEEGLYKYKDQPELQQQIIDWSLHFDYKIMAKNYLNLYHKILG
ncbi:glycosyltransferase [Elizabethkingia argentiflava]|uniref:Glycosyltransferase n=1 Tax=Elizabethkingia argenteiflava TaxID=2681556 RepID=A0A845PW97_9FLAO|nr:glycosyltransferase family 1 protein [Elizabethkingia argenteiflava]NAW51251.1 glycosyltransferase [Elizabethkingia argenteiflava]